MKSSKRISSEIMSMVIMGVLFLAMLLLVVFAASGYRASVQMQKENNDTRAAVSYVITAVKANMTDTIRLENIDGIDTLVITDSISGLEQRIYYREGSIIENYGAVGYDFYQDSETVIGNAEIFEITMESDSFLKIKTEHGDSYVNLKK